MLQSVRALMLPAAQARILLLVNHVLMCEPAAMRRLLPHAGRTLRVELIEAPRWAPALPPWRVRVTAAGLFEADAAAFDGDADLTVQVKAPTPDRLLAALAGDERPEVRIDGDAALAADVSWLAEHLRWDVEADLSQVLGPVAARAVASLGRATAGALRGVLGPSAPLRGGEPR